MFSLRDLIIFLAGAEFFHTLSHIILAYIVKYPWKTKLMTVTFRMNIWAIVINAVATIALIIWGFTFKMICINAS